MSYFYSFYKELELQNENKEGLDYPLLSLLLFITTIPLQYGINNITLIVFSILVLINLKKHKILIQIQPLFLVLFFFVAVITVLWSIDSNQSIMALPKFIPFILMPIIFVINKPFNQHKVLFVIKTFSYSMVFYALYFLTKALFNYLIDGDFSTFFYHKLIPKDLNAIHFSVYLSFAFFYFISNEFYKDFVKFICLFLLLFMILLSAYAILLTFIFLILYYFFYFSRTGHQLRLRNLIVFSILIISLFFARTIEKILEKELISNTEKSINHNVIEKKEVGLKVVSIKEAWTKEKFSPNDFFPGTAFRVYQFRIFLELMQEEKAWLTGFGLNASKTLIEKKAKEYNLFLGNEKTEGYQHKNFHNQYIQTFAELGVFGFLILIAMLGINLRNAIKNKDFLHFAFAVLMISLFLTESFLWRQRGVVFFTLLYCLFNIGLPQVKKSIE